MEEARIETEQKLLYCSEKGSSVAVARKSRVLSHRDSDGSVWRSGRAVELGRDVSVRESLNELISITRDGPSKRLANDHCKIDVKKRTESRVKGISNCTKNDVTVSKQIASNLGDQNMMLLQSLIDQNSAVYHYLEQLGRNEYIH